MKAATRTRYGSPAVLEVKEVPKPQPKDREVLVKVYTTTVNRTDCGMLRGKPYLIRLFTGLFGPSALVLGTDFAGEIQAIGKKVSTLTVGDRVWGLHDNGIKSQAQYMTIREDKAVVRIPANISYEDAAASAEGAHYAYNFITKVPLKKGSKVLVNGATGAIGSAAVQLLKHFGAYVTAVGNTKNMKMVKSLGADKTIDYLTTDFTKDEERYHFVFDAVGKSSFSKIKHLLLPEGVYISSELGPGAENLYLPLLTKLKGGKRVIFPIPINCRRSILLLSELLEKGSFQPVIDRVYPLKKIKEAYTYVESGEKTGNVVIQIPHDH